MSSHVIRLRKAWTLRNSNSTTRIDLPSPSLAFNSPFQLERTWSRPSGLDPDSRLALEFVRVPGLLTVRLNQERAYPAPDPLPTAWNLPLDQCEPRNLVVLDVDPHGLSPEDLRDWGDIRLVITEYGV